MKTTESQEGDLARACERGCERALRPSECHMHGSHV